jgi:hypothetical protein
MGIEEDSSSYFTRMKLTKLDNNGDMVWERVIGGTIAGTAGGLGPYSDGVNFEFHNGSLYVIAYTQSSDFPVTNGSVFDTTRPNFVYMKINATTGTTLFSTFTNEIQGYPSLIKFDGDFAYLIGASGEVGLNYPNGSNILSVPANFVINKMNTVTNTFINTFTVDSCFIANGIPWGAGGGVEVIGNHIYIVANTSSSNFGVTNGSVLKGLLDMVYVKLNATTGAIEFASYFGGVDYTNPYPYHPYATPPFTVPTIIKKDNGNLYIQVSTNTSEFPYSSLICIDGTNNTIIFSKPEAGMMEVKDGIIYFFNNKLDNNSSDLEFKKLNGNTGETISSIDFTSPTDNEIATAMTIINGEAYLLGQTGLNQYYNKILPSGFPITNGVTTYSGNSAFTVTKISSDNKICYSTYLGGSNDYWNYNYWNYGYYGYNDLISAYDNSIYLNGFIYDTVLFIH